MKNQVKRKLHIILLLSLVWPFSVMSQDLQFSQFYANALYHNPAFAGTVNHFRASLDYRYQWVNLENPYSTAFVSADYNIKSANSGVGIYFLNDRAGVGNYQTNEIAAQYSYKVKLDRYNVISLGLQPSFVIRSVNYNNFIFGDQLTDEGVSDGESDENRAGKDNLSYLDVSAGALYYNELLWAGIAAHHMNTPAMSFDNTGEKLPMKLSLHAGGQLRLMDERNNFFYVIPAIHYKMQGYYDQLDLGVYMNYNNLVAGLWYRGLPVKNTVKGTTNHDAFTILLGVSKDDFSFGYSYDIGLSKLTNTLMGAHELTIRYEVGMSKRSKEVPIPRY